MLKIQENMWTLFYYNVLIRVSNTEEAGGARATPLFCVAKRKKGDKGKKERASKQKLLKGCHQGENIIILAILEHLEFEKFLSANHGGRQYFSVFHGLPTLKSISPALLM